MWRMGVRTSGILLWECWNVMIAVHNRIMAVFISRALLDCNWWHHATSCHCQRGGYNPIKLQRLTCTGELKFRLATSILRLFVVVVCVFICLFCLPVWNYISLSTGNQRRHGRPWPSWANRNPRRIWWAGELATVSDLSQVITVLSHISDICFCAAVIH